MASTRPRPKSLNQIKSNLMKPATTSHFDVFIVEPSGASDYSWSQMKKDNGIDGSVKNFFISLALRHPFLVLVFLHTKSLMILLASQRSTHIEEDLMGRLT